MMTKSKIEIYGSENMSLSDNFLTEKVRYILDSPSQRKKYQRLKTDDQKIQFFLEHFIMTDLAIRQLKNIYLSTDQGPGDFLRVVNEIIHQIEETN